MSGPLCQLWEDILHNPDAEEVPAEVVLSTIQRSLVLLGQLNVKLSNYRRSAILEGSGNKDLAKSSRDDMQPTTGTQLFGEQYFKSLQQKGEDRKTLAKGYFSLVKSSPQELTTGVFSGPVLAKTPQDRVWRSFTEPRSLQQREVVTLQQGIQQSCSQSMAEVRLAVRELAHARKTVVPVSVEKAFVAGGVSKKVTAWAAITTDPWVLATVQGYRIPFHAKPVQKKELHQPVLSMDEHSALCAEVQELVRMQAVEPASPNNMNWVSPLFVVPKGQGRWRVIFNLKSLNQFVASEHFKMQTLYDVP